MDIDIQHDEIALEVYDHSDLPGHALVALRNSEDSRHICLTLPEAAAACHELRVWMATQGVSDVQIENMALRWREENPERG